MLSLLWARVWQWHNPDSSRASNIIIHFMQRQLGRLSVISLSAYSLSGEYLWFKQNSHFKSGFCSLSFFCFRSESTEVSLLFDSCQKQLSKLLSPHGYNRMWRVSLNDGASLGAGCSGGEHKLFLFPCWSLSHPYFVFLHSPLVTSRKFFTQL